MEEEEVDNGTRGKELALYRGPGADGSGGEEDEEEWAGEQEPPPKHDRRKDKVGGCGVGVHRGAGAVGSNRSPCTHC